MPSRVNIVTPKSATDSSPSMSSNATGLGQRVDAHSSMVSIYFVSWCQRRHAFFFFFSKKNIKTYYGASLKTEKKQEEFFLIRNSRSVNRKQKPNSSFATKCTIQLGILSDMSLVLGPALESFRRKSMHHIVTTSRCINKLCTTDAWGHHQVPSLMSHVPWQASCSEEEFIMFVECDWVNQLTIGLGPWRRQRSGYPLVARVSDPALPNLKTQQQTRWLYCTAAISEHFKAWHGSDGSKPRDISFHRYTEGLGC